MFWFLKILATCACWLSTLCTNVSKALPSNFPLSGLLMGARTSGWVSSACKTAGTKISPSSSDWILRMYDFGSSSSNGRPEWSYKGVQCQNVGNRPNPLRALHLPSRLKNLSAFSPESAPPTSRVGSFSTFVGFEPQAGQRVVSLKLA